MTQRATICLPVDLDDGARAEISRLKPAAVPKGSVLFRPGDEPPGFFLIESGRVGVYLVGRGGREILLYAVAPGETCVQTTLGLLGGQAYTGEAVAETDLVAYIVPKPLFSRLMAESAPFRQFVFKAFGARLADVMRVLEQVAFVKVEERLAALLLDRADPAGLVTATHQELAVAIGSAREVVSRRLEAFGAKGLVALDRGMVRIVDRAALKRLAG
ncbi:MAG: Crp/Fnr family transcriptional regulator [Phyllobacteriaceae bacterium]|nr:Crp/Fnr family transcriptional regulator [Phyllobacteriaceae bacterium]